MVGCVAKSLVGAVLFGLGSLTGAVADTYPSRPVTIIVPFGAGGPTDVVARVLAEHMREPLGQNVVVEAISGGSGLIGVQRVVRATPDGYTVGIGNWPSHVVNGAIMSLPYDVTKDLEPVTLLSANPYVLLARKNLPANNLREFIAWLKANPGKASEGTGGIGSGQHIGGLYFEKATGTEFNFVPYRAGSIDIIRDLAGGHIDFTFDQAVTALAHVKSGSVKAFAVTQKNRLVAAPDIPAVDEVGAPGVHMTTWIGLWVPAGTPRDVKDKIAAAARAALANPTVANKLIELGQEIFPVAQQTPEGLAAYHKAEIDKWWPIIKAAGIKLDPAK